jgi:hypothetical protein
MTLTRPETRFERFLPLAGILGGLLWAAAVVLTSSQPHVTGGAQGYVHWFASHQAQGVLASAAAGYFCVLMLLFAVAVRRAIRPAAPAHAAAAFAGGIGLALSTAVTGMILSAEADAAHHSAAALTTIGFLDGNTWLLTAASAAAFYLAVGLGSLRAQALPRPWAVVTVVLGAVCLIPLGGVAVYFAMPVWLVVTGTVLYRRQADPAVTTMPAAQPESSIA